MKLAARTLRRELHAPVKRWQVVLAVFELVLILLGLAVLSAYGEEYVWPVLLCLVGLSAAVVASSLFIREWLHQRKKQRGFRLDLHPPAGDPPNR